MYVDIFYNWEEILKERQEILRKEEMERNTRIDKSKQLRGTWEIMRVCKDFLEEWEGDWSEGSEKTRAKQEELKRQ